MVQVRKGMRDRCTTDFAVPGKSSTSMLQRKEGGHTGSHAQTGW